MKWRKYEAAFQINFWTVANLVAIFYEQLIKTLQQFLEICQQGPYFFKSM
jgi:hypothetical protein